MIIEVEMRPTTNSAQVTPLKYKLKEKINGNNCGRCLFVNTSVIVNGL